MAAGPFGGRDRPSETGRSESALPGHEIRHRLLLAMINAAADLLYDGAVPSPADIDLVAVHGCGFPRWRGGLMYHADAMAPQYVLGALRGLAREDPAAWQVSPMIEDCIARRLPFGRWTRLPSS